MKKNYSVLKSLVMILILFQSTKNYAQCLTDDYSTNLWTTVGGGPTVGSGTMNFVGTADGAFNYSYRALGFTLSNTDTWTAEVDFTPSAGVCPAHTIMAVTAGTVNSWNVSSGPWVTSNEDDIEVYYTTPFCNGSNSWQLVAASKDGSVWNTPSGGINIDPVANPGATYYIRLQRLSPTQGLLSVFSDPTFITPVGSPQCFPIVNNGLNVVTGLTTVQHGCIPQGSPTRKLTATLDNLRISNNVHCESYSIPGHWAVTGSNIAVTAGVCQLTTCADAADNRVDMNLNNALIGPVLQTSTQWMAQTEFKPTAISFAGPGHGILCLSNGSAQNIWQSPTPTQDVIAAYFTSTYNGGSGTWKIYGQAKQGNTWSAASTGINLPTLNVTYYVMLERLDATCGRLSVFSDAAHLHHVTGSPQTFTIPSGLTGLNTLDHCAMQQGASSRTMSATIDNTCIYNQYETGGTIGSDQIICYGATPQPLTSVLPSSHTGCSGTGTYQWEQEVPCGSGNWTAITGATNATYSPSSLTTTTCFRRTATVGPCSMTLYSNSVTITVDGQLTAVAGVTSNICCNTNPAFITLGGNPMGTGSTAVGGTGPYTYTWTSSVAYPNTFTNSSPYDHPVYGWLPAICPVNSFTVTVTDAYGCQATNSCTITLIPCRLSNPNSGQNNVETTDVMSIAPNPTSGSFNITFASDANHDVEVVNVLGKTVYHKTEISDPTLQIDLSGQPKGVYFVKCKEGDQVFVQRVVLQ